MRYIRVSVNAQLLDEDDSSARTIYLIVDTDPLPNGAAVAVVRTVAAHVQVIEDALNASVA